jgi:hypothetical protein
MYVWLSISCSVQQSFVANFFIHKMSWEFVVLYIFWWHNWDESSWYAFFLNLQKFKHIMRELQGAIIIGSAFQALLGYTGLMSLLVRYDLVIFAACLFSYSFVSTWFIVPPNRIYYCGHWQNECVCHFKGCEVQVQKKKINEVNWLRHIIGA